MVKRGAQGVYANCSERPFFNDETLTSSFVNGIRVSGRWTERAKAA